MSILLCALLFGIIDSNFALYFSVKSATSTCFILEQPKNSPIVFSYEILDTNNPVDFSVYYGTQALKELRIVQKLLVDPVGHIDFTADNNGFYSVCVQQPSTKDHLTSTRLKLSIDYGYDNDYYDKLMKDQNFDTVNMEVHKLNDAMMRTLNEADFQKHKEVEYHSQTESMDSATLWWPMLQIGILVVTGIVQVQHLKSFFKSNKLI